MTIYEMSVGRLLWKYVSDRPNQEAFTSEEIIEFFSNNYPKIKTSTVQAHLLQHSTNVRSRVHYKANEKHNLFFREGPNRFRRYNQATDPKPIVALSDARTPLTTSGEETSEAAPPINADESSQGDAFAYESHLRDYLARNLGVLEPGLRIYEDGEIQGIEYPVRQKRIDLLARGRDGAIVVIELKVSRGHYSTVGQILTYMGWVRKDIAEGAPVRGIIVAAEISDEIKAAVAEAKADISLFEYELSFKVSPVKADP